MNHKKLKSIRQMIGTIHDNIRKRDAETNKELMILKNDIDLILSPAKKGYVRFQTMDGFVEFKPRK